MKPGSLKTTGVIGSYFDPLGGYTAVRLGPIPPSPNFSRML
jgi:hypothetical protein